MKASIRGIELSNQEVRQYHRDRNDNQPVDEDGKPARERRVRNK